MRTVAYYAVAIAVGMAVGSWQVRSWQERSATLTIQCVQPAEVIPPATVTQFMADRQRLLKSL